ncbi:MAG TPA: helix-turn-helix transcriptional regulator [Acidimicrobiales bacterium]|nr:helix-turn-helix transcriptional regulator [Acidimicrobiales bacterium]
MDTARRISSATELGRALARGRSDAGITQEEMARRLGVDRSYLARLETGRSTEQLRRIFSYLRELNCEIALADRGASNGR